jgi:nucleoside-diphosphate-sugar epimerase
MKISIVGCGWLGLPLAENLIRNNHTVLGSTTSKEKLTLLSKKGIKPFLMNLNPMPEGQNFNELFNSELMIINLPPKSRTKQASFYREQIKYLKYLLAHSVVKKVIFISSTSYYPNSNASVDESTMANISLGSNQAVVWGEQEIRNIKQELIILRCGGLMGGDRIPGKWFSGKETEGADTPVNYIHREDVIKHIASLVTKEKWNRIENLVNSNHLSRKTIHEAMAKKYGFLPPVWIKPEMTSHKRVESKYRKSENDKNLMDY